MDALVQGFFEQSVVGALDDGQAQVVGESERIQTFAHLRQIAFNGQKIAPLQLLGLQQGEVVDHIDIQQAQFAAAALAVMPFGPVLARMVHEVGDHMEIADQAAIVADQKAAADGTLGAALGIDDAHLDHAGLVSGEHLFGGPVFGVQGRCQQQQGSQDTDQIHVRTGIP